MKAEDLKTGAPLPDALHGLWVTYPHKAGAEQERAIRILRDGEGAPYVAGAAHMIKWHLSEPESCSYDWRDCEERIDAWLPKPSGLLLCPTGYQGEDVTPAWYPGPRFNSVCESGSLPVYWDAEGTFRYYWERFILAAVHRYRNDDRVAYIRPGFGVGFEHFPCANNGFGGECDDLLAELNYSPAIWRDYLSEMTGFLYSLRCPKLQVSLSFDSYATRDPTTPNMLGDLAAEYGFAIASAGLQSTDMTADPDNSSNASLTVYSEHIGEVPLGAQTVELSDPTERDPANRTGSLAPLIPFAIQHGVQWLEIFANDWFATYDPEDARHADAIAAGYPEAFARAASVLGSL